jgi:adenylate cyclase class 2
LTEHEIKLRFDTPEAAREAVVTAGGRLVVSRRLLVDTLHDTADQALRQIGSALRLRRDRGRTILTFKGPTRKSDVKSREEIETGLDDGDAVEQILERLGFRVWFRAEKYREEYEIEAAHIALDEAPIGVFVEIEANPDEIARCARRLGRSPSAYCLQSYQALYFAWCQANGVPPGDMTFNA